MSLVGLFSSLPIYIQFTDALYDVRRIINILVDGMTKKGNVENGKSFKSSPR
jgi:hypothetical protein